MKIIVGSTALEYFGMSRRKAVDLDIWYNGDYVFPAGLDVQKLPLNILSLVPTVDGYATPDAIYTIKCSHLEYDIFFQKHKLDVLFLKSKGCTLIPKLYSALKDYWKGVHGNKEFLSLNQSKEDFFTDNVTYIYDHDYLHELVAYPNRPMYTNCLKDGEEVLIDKDKFFAMSFEDQVRMFREEITVIAAERWMINPYWKNKLSWYRAHMFSVQKTITRLSKNWASEFMVMNIEHFVKPDYSYALIDNPDYDFETYESECDSSYSYIVCELIESNYESEWKKEHYPEQAKWAADNGLKFLEGETGGEGSGEYCYAVFSWKGKTYKIEFSYYSYHGNDFDDVESTIREVKPVQKMVTVWE